MCVTEQCASWNPRTNKRCMNEVYKSSKHCVNHYKKALELYLNYKKLCEEAYKLDIEKLIKNRRKKIKHLRHCHKLLVNAYNARLAHRNYAFAPECHDFGHDLQFQIIQDKIDKCNTELLSLKIKNNEDDLECDDNNNDDDDDDGDEIIDEEIKERSESPIKETKDFKEIKETKEIKKNIKQSDYKLAMKEMKEFNAKRKQDERETEKLIADYIRINKAYLDERSEVLGAIIDGIKVFCRTDNFYINLAVHKTIWTLEKIDYFDIELNSNGSAECPSILTPHKAFTMESKGKSYSIGYLVLTKDKTSMPSDLSAAYDHMCICRLKHIGRLIVRNIHKIKPIIRDVLELFKLYGNSILSIQLEIRWSGELNRLVLSKSGFKSARKRISRQMAMSRLNEKAYIQRALEKLDESKRNGDEIEIKQLNKTHCLVVVKHK